MRPLLRFALPLMLLWVAPAYADLSVTGDSSGVTVDATSASLRDIIDGLVKQTGMKIDLEGTDDTAIDGKFTGSVADVLTQMLRNMSFMITDPVDGSAAGLRVVIIGPAVSPVAPPIPDPAMADPNMVNPDPTQRQNARPPNPNEINGDPPAL